MQAIIQDVGMCCCSCANSDKGFLWFFVFVFFFPNRCVLETWGVMLQVTNSPGLSLLTWPPELCVCKSVRC